MKSAALAALFTLLCAAGFAPVAVPNRALAQPGGSIPVTGAIATTATTTSGKNTFAVDVETAGKISAGMAIISTAFPEKSYVASIVGTTVTVGNVTASPNAKSTGRAPVQFGHTRVYAPFFGAKTLMATQGYFGSAAIGNTTWNWKYNPSPDFFGEGVISMNNSGGYGGYFSSHTAAFGSAGHASTYGVFLNSINDNPVYSNTIWGYYVQCEQAPGAAQALTLCGEISPVNYGAAGTPVDPYANNSGKAVETLRLDAGNGSAGLSNGSDIIHMIGNRAKVLHGIDVSSDLLDFKADAHAPAMAMPKNAALTWYSATRQKGWSIYDTTSTNIQNSLAFSATAMASSAPMHLPDGTASAPAVQIGASNVGLYNSGSGIHFAVAGADAGSIDGATANFGGTGLIFRLRNVSCASGNVSLPSWRDFSIEITALPASGTCKITLATNPQVGQQIRISDATGDAAKHNIVISPEAGSVDGSTSYAISTNWGSWSGEYTGSIFKTVAKL